MLDTDSLPRCARLDFIPKKNRSYYSLLPPVWYTAGNPIAAQTRNIAYRQALVPIPRAMMPCYAPLRYDLPKNTRQAPHLTKPSTNPASTQHQPSTKPITTSPPPSTRPIRRPTHPHPHIALHKPHPTQSRTHPRISRQTIQHRMTSAPPKRTLHRRGPPPPALHRHSAGTALRCARTYLPAPRMHRRLSAAK